MSAEARPARRNERISGPGLKVCSSRSIPARMAKKPQSSKPTTSTIYKIAAKAVRLHRRGRRRGHCDREGRRRIQGAGHETGDEPARKASGTNRANAIAKLWKVSGQSQKPELQMYLGRGPNVFRLGNHCVLMRFNCREAGRVAASKDRCWHYEARDA